mgnify:FL=1
MRLFFRACCVAAVANLFLTVGAAPADEKLPRDPNNFYGRFENGFSYIIREHKNPPDRVAFFLHVDTGALNETDSQNGLAHFLEHMAFNGSKNFEPGELIPYMNKLGMRFGADSNAHTNHEETVYKLFMPDTDPETIEKAMIIFSDFAYGMLLLPEEIDKERKVILEEARSRKSAMERIQKEWMKKVFEGSRVAVHDVIGDEEQIAAFPREEFADYWDTWYRPENMTLIVIGDINSDAIIKAAKKHFSEFNARRPARKPSGAGIKPYQESRAFVLTDPEQVMCQAMMTSIRPARDPITTYEDYRFNEVENIGTWIVGRRLREMVDKGDAAFRMSGLFVRNMFYEAIMPSAMAIGQPEEWQKMVEQAITETRRAIEHGFTDQELKLAKEEFLSNAERAAERESTLDAGVLINRMSRAVGDRRPILSAAQELDLMRRILKDVTLEEVHKVFVQNFETENYTYSLAMPEKKDGMEIPSPGDVLAVASAAWASETKAPTKAAVDKPLLASKPKAGKVASSETDDELKITTAILSNGVVVHHRFMDYEKDKVLVSLVMPGGTIEESSENRGVSEVAEIAFNSPATSRLDSTQVRDLMTGRKIRLGANIDMDSLTISLSGSPADLPFGMELAYALITDGKIEQAAFDNWKRQRVQRLEMLRKMPQGQLRTAMEQTIFASDPRLCDLTDAQIDELDPAKGQTWLRHITDKAAIEMTIVGDIKLEPAMELACAYIGALPERSSGFDALDRLRKLDRDEGPYEKKVEFESVTPKAIVLAGFVGCEEDDKMDRRALSLATRILTDRFTKRIREEEQLVYGIGCQSQPARTIPGLGMIFGAAPTDPQNADLLADTVLEMMREFAAKGPTDEEVGTAQKQIITDLKTRMKEPDFWFAQIREMKYRDRPLEELKELPEVYEKFTAEQLKDVAAKYMTDARLIRLVVIPKPMEEDEDTGKKEPVSMRTE